MNEVELKEHSERQKRYISLVKGLPERWKALGDMIDKDGTFDSWEAFDEVKSLVKVPSRCFLQTRAGKSRYRTQHRKVAGNIDAS